MTKRSLLDNISNLEDEVDGLDFEGLNELDELKLEHWRQLVRLIVATSQRLAETGTPETMELSGLIVLVTEGMMNLVQEVFEGRGSQPEAQPTRRAKVKKAAFRKRK